MPSDELKKWQVLERASVVDATPWLKVWSEKIRLPDGRVVNDFYTLEQADYVVIFALVDQANIIGFWRYKHGSRRVNLGLPAGYVEEGEDSLRAAQRELLEETGYRAENWDHLGTYDADGNRGLCQVHIFLAQDLEEVALPDPDDLEEMQMVSVPLVKLQEYLRSGEVSTLGAASAIAMGLIAVTNP